LNLSSKTIGQQSFCRKVEEWHQERVATMPDPSGVARRRVEVGWKPEEILERVAAELAVDKEELRRQRGGDWRRWLTMKLLHEKGGLTQRAVGRMMGMKNRSEVSRYLRKSEEKAQTDAQCRAQLIELGNMISA
jgi:chromosomal replication initiation ATPase DnaA